MKANINLSENSENTLKKIEVIGKINGKKVNNKEQQIELALLIAEKCVTLLDDESLLNVTGLKKTF